MLPSWEDSLVWLYSAFSFVISCVAACIDFPFSSSSFLAEAFAVRDLAFNIRTSRQMERGIPEKKRLSDPFPKTQSKLGTRELQEKFLFIKI